MIHDWIQRVIEGPGGLNVFEKREGVVCLVSDRMAAANWIIRCLGNPDCEGSAEVLAEIMAHRERMKELR